MSFTGNRDVDHIILLSLDDVNLENVCHSSAIIHQLCNNDLYPIQIYLIPI